MVDFSFLFFSFQRFLWLTVFLHKEVSLVPSSTTTAVIPIKVGGLSALLDLYSTVLGKSRPWGLPTHPFRHEDIVSLSSGSVSRVR